ncbi:MAG: amidohydrolase [Prevotella sp.]|nr:amidohydrolase [Prevotella sp.]
MTIAIVQTDIRWADPAVNRLRIEELIKDQSADLFVLPEMFSTGFATQPEGIAEEDNSSLAWMKEIALQRQAAIAGSIAVRDDEHYYNRFYFVKPDGEISTYDKRHLFTYGEEDLFFTAGTERTIVEYQGIRFLLEVCYDLRFPVWSRNRKDYDIILYVANWPTSRMIVWNTLLRARAIENQCFVAGVNRVGSDPTCEYSGGSMVIDAYGKVIADCGTDMPCCKTVELDLDRLNAFRKKFPVLDDADMLG